MLTMKGFKLICLFMFARIVVAQPQENKTAVWAVVYASSKRPCLVDTLSCAAAFIEEAFLPSHWKIQLNVTIVNNSKDRSGVVFYKAAKIIRRTTALSGLIVPEKDLFYYYLSDTKLPLFTSLSIDTQPKHGGFTWAINLKKSTNDQVSAMLSLISLMQPKNVAILCSSKNYYRYLAQTIYSTVAEYGISIELQRIVTEHEIGHAEAHQLLLHFNKTSNWVIVLLCPQDTICSILKQAEQGNMTSATWSWFLWNTETEDLNMGSCLSKYHYPLNLFTLRSTLPKTSYLTEITTNCAHNFTLDPVAIDYIASLCLFANDFNPFVLNNSVLRSTNYSDNGAKLLNFMQSDANLSSHRKNFGSENCFAGKDNSYEILHVENDEIKSVGSWNKSSSEIIGIEQVGLGESKHSTARDVKLTLENNELIVLTMGSSPFVIIDHDNGAPTFSGFTFELFKEIQNRLGFSYRVQVDHSGSFGIRNRVNGLWDGLIGELLSDNADIVVAAVTITPERQQVVDFTNSFFETNVKYIVNIHADDTLNQYGGYTFAQPYSISLWLSIFGTALAMGLYLTFMAKLSPYGAYGHYFQSEEAEASNIRLERRRSYFDTKSRASILTLPRRSSQFASSKDFSKEMGMMNAKTKLSGSKSANLKSRVTFLDDSTTQFLSDDEDSEDEREERRNAQRQMSLSNSMYFAFAAMLWQSPETVPRAPSTRIPASVWYMVGVIFVTTYTANLVAFVSQTTESSTLLNIRGLVSQKGVQVGTVQGSSINELIMSSDLKIAEKVQEAILRNPAKAFQPNQTAALQLVEQGQLAFIWDGAILNYAAQKSNCKLITVDLGFVKSSYSFALRKNSPFTEHISKILEELRNEGYLKQLQDKYFKESDKCDVNTEDTHSHDAPLTFYSLSGAFGILLIAAYQSLVVLGIEWIVASIKDVDKGDPRKPATFGRAIYLRWQRTIDDAKRNWLPCKKFRRRLWKYLSSNKGKKRKYRTRLPRGIEQNQWKRYTSSTDAKNLRPGLSISNPSMHDLSFNDMKAI